MEAGRKSRQRLVHDQPDRPQRVPMRHPDLEIDV
jgi:hypothetical protein